MSWEQVYLVCFIVGFALAAVGFLSGTLHFPHGHGLHLPGVHAAGAAHPAPAGAISDSSFPPFNFATAMVFLAWFGGTGYLLTRHAGFTRVVVLALAGGVGLLGAGIVFGFVTRVLLRYERPLEAADFDMVGVLGRVTVPIRSGGTGEIVYSQEGTRRSTGARSDSGQAIARGSEVVVTRYDGGIAYVRLWEELAGIGAPAAPGDGPSTETRDEPSRS
jgi:membrane protein implicated in regulation of membrane protease activity